MPRGRSLSLGVRRRYGNLVRADMAEDPNDPRTTKGFGFVSYDSPQARLEA